MSNSICAFCLEQCENGICTACGKSISEYTPAPHHLKPGTTLSEKYIVGAVLGEGGFGITYLCRDINLNINVAVKEYFPSGVVNRNAASSCDVFAPQGELHSVFEKGKNSFLEEARTLARFSNEPGIVFVRDFFSENNTAYIVMEYLNGTTLKEHIEQNGKMNFEQAVNLLQPILNTLSEIHSRGLIHRDISPSNIIILNDGSAKLLDFGAARKIDRIFENSISVLMKPGYTPEEQYRSNGEQGPWTDIYALSATIYKMLTGRTPDDAMNRLFSDNVCKITELNSSVTQEQEKVVFKGMSVKQADRYQSIADFYKDCFEVLISPSFSPFPTSASSIQEEAPENEPDLPEASVSHPKKPNLFALLCSATSGLFCLGMILLSVSAIIGEIGATLPVMLAVFFGGLSFLFGRGYFPRVDNRMAKPRTLALLMSILFTIITLVLAYFTYIVFSDVVSEHGSRELMLTATILSTVFPVFFGYFYYPRLERKKRIFYVKFYSSIFATVVAVFAGFIVFAFFNTVTIGDSNISRDETTVRLTLDIVSNNEISKLKELKNLETLIVHECFLDNDDIKEISQLTQLKELSLAYNTDITDVSPLNNLTGLTRLDISSTKVSDISTLDKLVNLETLNINNTKISDLGIVKNFTKLENFSMNSLENLNAATIALPSTIYTLHCNNNNLDSINFVNSSENLTNLYAAGNKISDINVLSKFKQLYMVDLSSNNISDISALPHENIGTLNLSKNNIADISALEGLKASMLDLSRNQITDISALHDSYNLISLDLSNNLIKDITPLKECFNISSLDVSFNAISNIRTLASIDNLSTFNARGNKISDISVLASCEKLIDDGNAIDLRDNQISNISALSKYKNTTYFFLSGNRISNITPLSQCTNLKLLYVNNNKISDLSPLKQLDNLTHLAIVNNPVRTLAPIADAEHSTFVYLTYNNRIDFEELSANDKLNIYVFGAPERQKAKLLEYGCINMPGESTLDDIENEDAGTEEDEANG